MSHCSLSVSVRHCYCICIPKCYTISELLGQKQSKTLKLFSFEIGIQCISQSLKWHVRFYTFMGYSNRISGLGFKPLYWISYRGNTNAFLFYYSLFFCLLGESWVIKGRLSIAKLIHISQYFIGYVINNWYNEFVFIIVFEQWWYDIMVQMIRWYCNDIWHF